MPLRRTISWMLLLAAFPAVSRAQDDTSKVLFSRHIVPLFAKLGCNSGSCHGAVKGQNGFRLSLFGADAAGDHERLVREFGRRRLNFVQPDESLLLLKATGQVPHQGGARLFAGSPEYEMLRGWIEREAPLDTVEKSALAELKVTPASQPLKIGQTAPVQVEARFADGSQENVTNLCTFETRDKQIAEVDAAGQVRAVGLGDTVLVARYRAEPAMAMILVPAEGKGDFPAVKESNFIDRHTLARLRQLNMQPAETCDDTTFLRRVSLDVTGALPTPDEVRSFLKDTNTDKRSKKIDELLGRSGHSALWATKFCDILKPTAFDAKAGLNETASNRRFYEWIRARIQENVPYDVLAERILTATSRDGRDAPAWVEEVKRFAAEDAAKTADLQSYAKRQSLDLYWQRQNATGVKGALQVAHAFLGLRLECAQCHRHPHDVWQQEDLLQFANFFQRVSGTGEKASSAEVAPMVEMLQKQSKELLEQAKKITEKAKTLDKEEAKKLQVEAKEINDKAKSLETTAKRLKGTEIHVLAKGSPASVTSTLGQQKSDVFRLLGSKDKIEVKAGDDPRKLVLDWLRKPDNPFFARAIVNRVWAHYFGRGLIDPPDHLSPLNPPTHPELLRALCDDFIASKFDLRALHHRILNSRTYQQSAQTNAATKLDSTHYGSFYPRRLPAEVLVDAINHATAGKETFPPELLIPANSLAIEVAGGVRQDNKKASLHYALQIFGRPLRSPEVLCDCERDQNVTIVQSLYLANHPAVQAKITSADGRLAKIAATFSDDGERLDEIFLWTLSRLPTSDEKQQCLTHMKSSEVRQRGLEDILWSLINTREFLLNH